MSEKLTYLFEWEPDVPGRDYLLLEFDVDLYHVPGSPGRHTLSNGDPGYPGHDPYTEIGDVRLRCATDDDGEPVEVDAEEWVRRWHERHDRDADVLEELSIWALEEVEGRRAHVEECRAEADREDMWERDSGYYEIGDADRSP